MPRRPAIIERDIPLFLIPHKAGRRGTHGDALDRVVVKRGSHFFTISIRTRPIKRELKRSCRTRPGLPVPLESADDPDYQ